WGDPAAFFSHPALIALAVALFVIAGVAFFDGGKLGAGVGEDRDNRWVIAAFALIGLLAAFLPAYTDRKEFWTVDGDTVRWIGVVLFTPVARCGSGRSLCSATGSAGSSPSSPGIPWSQAVFIASSAIRAIWGYSSVRWGGALPFVRGPACCSRRS